MYVEQNSKICLGGGEGSPSIGVCLTRNKQAMCGDLRLGEVYRRVELWLETDEVPREGNVMCLYLKRF